MKRHHLLLCSFVVFILTLTPYSAAGQTENANVVALRRALTGQTLTVHIAGLHAAPRSFIHPVDNRIVAGVVQSRKLDMIRVPGDVVLPPGSTVQIVRVDSASDANSDILRIGVTGPGGVYSSLAFIAPRISLSTSSVGEMAALVGSVLIGPAVAALEAPSMPQPPSTQTGSTALQGPDAQPSVAASGNDDSVPIGSTVSQTRSSVAAPLAQATEGKPRAGVWSYAAKSNARGTARAAVTSVMFSPQYGANGVPATLVLVCDDSASGGAQPELRAVFPPGLAPPPGFIGVTGRMVLSEVTTRFKPELGTYSGVPALVVPLRPTDLAVLADENDVEPAGIYISFGVGVSFKGDLPVRNSATQGVVDSCHVTLPFRAARQLAALSPSETFHLTLAKVTLGMTNDELHTALGPQFRFENQGDTSVPGVVYEAANNPNTFYKFTLINGHVAAFNFRQTYETEKRPVIENLASGITAKTWAPVRTTADHWNAEWLTDAQGKPVIKEVTTGIPHCVGSRHPYEDPGTITTGPGGFERPTDRGDNCGVMVGFRAIPWTDPTGHTDGTAKELDLNVDNEVVFHQLIQQRAASQDKVRRERQEKNNVASPF